jgi:2-dehydropantoate 2-reductase
MGQVPYGIIGDGRLARHLIHYFNLQGIPYQQWSHKGPTAQAGTSAVQALSGCRTILLAIQDSAIENVAREFLAVDGTATQQRLVHFSGALVTRLATGMHPLMTFSTGFYDLSEYQKMAFVCEEGEPKFQDVFPKLKNPHYVIRKDQKAFYHALCVMSGNFSVILWQKLFEEFRTKLGIPAEAAFPYLERMTRNLQGDSRAALTGPLQRKDLQTIHKNLESLDGDSFRGIYQAFASAMGVSS